MVSDSLSVHPKYLRSREQYFFALFRCLEAALLALWVFSPFAPYFNKLNPLTPLNALSIVFLLTSVGFFVLERRNPRIKIVLLSLRVDIIVFAGLAWLLPIGFYSVALMLLANLAAGGLLLSKRQSAIITLCAITVLLGHYLFNIFTHSGLGEITQSLMFAVIYATTVLFYQMLANQAQQSQALADERGQQLIEMAQMNELIIKRMRTGVILLDSHHRIVLSNEAANGLNHKAIERGQMLNLIAPELDKRLWHWRQNPEKKPQALTLYNDGPEVIPRFVALLQHEVMYIAFLEDSRVFSGRADELQLASLGLLSASIAHEIRNPLAAISYAQQLMAESDQISSTDRNFLEIIGKQSKRMNGIVENILQLAKREAAHPESLDIDAFCETFLSEFIATRPQEQDKIVLQPSTQSAIGLFDPLHLYQVLSILLNNALNYGHDAYQTAFIQVLVRMDNNQPIIDVIDHGPGIPAEQAKHLFTPFYTMSDHGTGLGLYIAKQLAEANQCLLRYDPVLGGGSRFSLKLSNGQSILTH